MLEKMVNWFRRRNTRADGVDRGYVSFSDTDLEHGYRTPEEAMLERIQKGEHVVGTFDELHCFLGKVFIGVAVIVTIAFMIIMFV
jgi:hypothetical protein